MEKLGSLNTNNAKLEAPEKARGIAGSLEEGLQFYLRSPQADPAVLDNVQSLVTQLVNALIVAGQERSGRQKQDDLDAVILGSAMVLDPAREKKADIESTKETAHRFIELVQARFRSLE